MKTLARGQGLPPFEYAQARGLIADLLTPRLEIFLADFGLAAGLGWGLFAVCALVPMGALLYWILLTLSGLALFRALMFIHQVFHLPPKLRRIMQPVFQLGVGFPLLVPLFMFEGSHIYHHHKERFGRAMDPEYRDLSRQPRSAIFGTFATAMLGQWLIVLRFLFVAPLSFLHPRLRTFTRRKFSSLSLKPEFERPYDANEPDWWRQELGASLAAWAWVGGWITGLLSTQTLLQWFYVGTVVTFLNVMQIFFLHRYLGQEDEGTLEDQILDSHNLDGRFPWLTEIWAPAGQRFHALHHIFPTLPYHSMPEAHRRLLAGLPAHSVYRLAETTSYLRAFRELWNRPRKT